MLVRAAREVVAGERGRVGRPPVHSARIGRSVDFRLGARVAGRAGARLATRVRAAFAVDALTVNAALIVTALGVRRAAGHRVPITGVAAGSGHQHQGATQSGPHPRAGLDADYI